MIKKRIFIVLLSLSASLCYASIPTYLTRFFVKNSCETVVTVEIKADQFTTPLDDTAVNIEETIHLHQGKQAILML